VSLSVPAVEVVVQMTGVVRSHQALRPLRIAALTLARGERVAVHGVDAPAAEVLINLVTGAALPDEGEVRIFGRATSEIQDGDAWLASLDRFGIVSPRAVMMDGAAVLQNLAMPFTLNIDPVPDETIRRVEALAQATGIPREVLGKAAGDLTADVRVRVHLARALALDPALLLVEHPTAGVEKAAVPPLADDVARALEARGTTALIISQDETFASRTATRRLTLQPGTGQLKPVRKGWFGR
jgi:ABC-type transporter Mla maintaining outer membrane lipid asymmetry ATPase subunit MlaF